MVGRRSSHGINYQLCNLLGGVALHGMACVTCVPCGTPKYQYHTPEKSVLLGGIQLCPHTTKNSFGSECTYSKQYRLLPCWPAPVMACLVSSFVLLFTTVLFSPLFASHIVVVCTVYRLISFAGLPTIV